MPAVLRRLLMRITFFFLLLLSVNVLAFWRGRSDERLAALTCVGGALLTLVARAPIWHRFSQFELLSFGIDLAIFLAFLAIALRSERFWPMWVAGLQLTATTVHLLKLVNPDLMRFVFGAALAFWSYPILILIAVGAWRTSLVERWRSPDIAGRGTIP
ncbi:hypothetical protein [Sphingomonas sp. LHG3406-1]|uniref:hypothetical protein n=1 Tax=Sphingomonas sp. LHG3406-1 TaxID=2804617 RepID=UPI0026368E8E|nr:hypothetical protein [Sphingomonas sp. LHG3406-1]